MEAYLRGRDSRRQGFHGCRCHLSIAWGDTSSMCTHSFLKWEPLPGCITQDVPARPRQAQSQHHTPAPFCKVLLWPSWCLRQATVICLSPYRTRSNLQMILAFEICSVQFNMNTCKTGELTGQTHPMDQGPRQQRFREGDGNVVSHKLEMSQQCPGV